jgi:hypothetical protein
MIIFASVPEYNKTDRHGIDDMLLKVALNTINQPIKKDIYCNPDVKKENLNYLAGFQ